MCIPLLLKVIKKKKINLESNLLTIFEMNINFTEKMINKKYVIF